MLTDDQALNIAIRAIEVNLHYVRKGLPSEGTPAQKKIAAENKNEAKRWLLEHGYYYMEMIAPGVTERMSESDWFWYVARDCPVLNERRSFKQARLQM